MENRLYLYNLGIKTFGGFATLGGVIQALQLFTQPDLDIKSILLSFPAWVVYVFVCLTIIFAMLRERYKSMSQRVEVLNVKIERARCNDSFIAGNDENCAIQRTLFLDHRIFIQ